MPSHLILFDNLVEKLPEVLVDYQQIHAIPHADVRAFYPFIDSTHPLIPRFSIPIQYTHDDRIGNKVLVYERANVQQRSGEISGSGDRATSSQPARKSQNQQKKKQT